MFGLSSIGMNLKLFALIAIAAIAGAMRIYLRGVNQGKDAIRNKINEKRLKNYEKASSVEKKVDALPDSDLRDLASKWVRNNDDER